MIFLPGNRQPLGGDIENALATSGALLQNLFGPPKKPTVSVGAAVGIAALAAAAGYFFGKSRR